MNATPIRLFDLLRETAPDGAPVELLLDSWPEVEDAVLADSSQAREALTAAAHALPPIAGAIADRRALATAVMSARGTICFADPAYLALFADSSDMRPLLKRALREGSVVSLVEGGAGAAFTAWVGDAQAARRWPLDRDATVALSEAPDRLAVVVSAPSRSSELARGAARALDLTALEARLAEALLFAPNLEAAAADVGVGRETARDALRRLNAKLGVRRTPELVAHLIGVMCAAQRPHDGDAAIAENAFGLTPAEARAAALVAGGATAPEAAGTLGVSAETVRTHVKAVLAKTGAKGVKDLARLLAEARELIALADAAEPMFGEEEGGGRLRIVPSLDRARRVALIDYGPYDGEPVFVFHGGAAGRRLPDRLRAGLISRGLRPIVIQRPGFGLSDPAVSDYLAAGADDMAAVVERLRLKRVRLLARDTGAPTALAFAQAYPGLIGRSVLLNPHPPTTKGGERRSFMASVQKHLLRNPDLVVAFAELLRRQATTALLERIFDRSMRDTPADHAALQDPKVREFLARDVQAMCARSVRGFVSEQAIYANGWEPPADLPADIWSLAMSGAVAAHADFGWSPVPGPPTVIDGAGLLVQFTHPEALVDLIA